MDLVKVAGIKELGPDQNLLVKHAVGGRLLLDARAEQMTVRIGHSVMGRSTTDVDGSRESGGGPTSTGTGAVITLLEVPEERAREVVKWGQELNVFLFEQRESLPTLKRWFYTVPDGVSYDKLNRTLVIRTSHAMEYVNE